MKTPTDIITPSIITIDGPAGVGKSTIARHIAEAQHMSYLDTGAMFRLLAFYLGKEAEHLPSSELRARCMAFSFQLEGTGERSILLCNGVPLDDRIRTEQIAKVASRLASNTVVREYLKTAQRIIGETTNLIAEGRDMGTVVFPQARYKFFLDASAEIRAKRRTDELLLQGKEADFSDILQKIQERDSIDRNRAIAPLKPADDAHIIDTSSLSIDEVIQAILTQVQAKPAMKKDLAFSHLDNEGTIAMVNVGQKPATERIAIAQTLVEINQTTLDLLQKQALPKGDVLVTAKLAGIMAAKQTAQLIPLCHPIPLTYIDIRLTIETTPPAIRIEAETHTNDRTGIEMEAIIAAQITAATIYDMCKAVQKDIVIRDTRLIYKSGGRSGTFQHAENKKT